MNIVCARTNGKIETAVSSRVVVVLCASTENKTEQDRAPTPCSALVVHKRTHSTKDFSWVSFANPINWATEIVANNAIASFCESTYSSVCR